jgi:hypothetical protein
MAPTPITAAPPAAMALPTPAPQPQAPAPPSTAASPVPAPQAPVAAARPTPPPAAAPQPVAVARPAAAAAHRGPTPLGAAAGGSDHGQLTIICFPACDSVADNGQVLGPSPIFKRSVSVGEHRLRMTSTNPPATKIVSVIVMGDQTTTVRQPMTP